ncbi:MAG: hypothetical protein LKI53_01810 [Bacteroidales bacterium]|jgi:hypothetical protein|nr:hypothetical protein [Bacteroidales bacterium]
MNGIGKIFLSVLLLSFSYAAVSSCRKNEGPGSRESYFLADKALGVMENGKYSFLYDSTNSQWAVNEKRKTFRYQNDMQTKYVSMVFSEKPDDPGKIISVYISFLHNGSVSSRTITMTVISINGGTCKLWDEGSNTGISIPLF